MQKDTLADIAVKITQVIKENLSDSAQGVIKTMLDKIPELANNIDLTAEYLLSIGRELGIEGDVNTIIEVIQHRAKQAASDIDWNSIW